MKKIATILGTRPEIIKLSPLLPLLDKNFSHTLIHTSQHFDANLDSVFFHELGLRVADKRLDFPYGVPRPLGEMFARLTQLLGRLKPELVLVQGDTNSSLAGALAAAQLGIPVAHVEAGCRSNDLKMPEEINRRAIDSFASICFAADEESYKNLVREGKKEISHLVGNTGLDAAQRGSLMCSTEILHQPQWDLEEQQYILATVHRAENTSEPQTLRKIVRAINRLSMEITVVWPMHPRTEKALRTHNIRLSPRVLVIQPQRYIATLSLLKYSLLALSDSGGLQEEAAVVNRPCFILRDRTEWTRLVRSGKNFLVGTDEEKIVKSVMAYAQNLKRQALIAKKKAELNFGASQRILTALQELEI